MLKRWPLRNIDALFFGLMQNQNTFDDSKVLMSNQC